MAAVSLFLRMYAVIFLIWTWTWTWTLRTWLPVCTLYRRFPDNHFPGQTFSGQDVSRTSRFPDNTFPGQDLSQKDVSRTRRFPDKLY